jgi:UDP-glucose 6-dehydrogenase
MAVDVKKYRFGIIGMGFLGSAITHGFGLHADIKIYDKFKNYDSLEDVVKHAKFIWMCLPTPMNMRDGNMDLSILEENLDKIHDMVSEEDRKVIIIKSTVVPGTTSKFTKKYPKLNFTMNPEFLTARNNKLDFICASRIIIGADEEWIADTMEEVYRYRFGNSISIYRTGTKEAELSKYGSNCFFAVKISYFNFIWSLCQKMRIDFDEVKDMILADGRIARSHANVPGWDGQRGYSGACLVSGTKVLTNGGYKNIENVVVGDQLYDGKQFTNVNRIGTRSVNKTIKIKARGREIEGSLDHIHMIYDSGQLKEKTFDKINKGEWVFIPKPKIKTIDTVNMGKKPVIKSLRFWKEEVLLTPDITRLMGLYCGDGFSGIYQYKNKKTGKVKKEYSVNWTFGEHEECLANEVVAILKNLGLNSYKKLSTAKNATFGASTTWRVRCRSLWLYRFFEKCELGRTAYNKNAPLFGGELAKGFISGWFDSDGSYYKKTGTLSAFSRSKSLVMNVDLMLLNMGICGFIKKDGQEINISTKKDVREISSWMKCDRFTFNKEGYIRETNYASPTMRTLEDGWAVKIRDVRLVDETKNVHPIETDSNLYVANGFVTHNCFPKDINALINFAESQGLDPKLISSSWEQNLEDRPSKDWEKIPSAVSNKNDD